MASRMSPPHGVDSSTRIGHTRRQADVPRERAAATKISFGRPNHETSWIRSCPGRRRRRPGCIRDRRRGARRQRLQIGLRRLSLRAGGRIVRQACRAGCQDRHRCAQRRKPAQALRQSRLRRPEDRNSAHRRGGRRHQASRGIAQRLRARSCRCGVGLCQLRRLPRGLAGGRGAQEASRSVRLRHASHLRGEQIQIRLSHGSPRRDG